MEDKIFQQKKSVSEIKNKNKLINYDSLLNKLKDIKERIGLLENKILSR